MLGQGGTGALGAHSRGPDSIFSIREEPSRRRNSNVMAQRPETVGHIPEVTQVPDGWDADWGGDRSQTAGHLVKEFGFYPGVLRSH